MAGPAGPEAGVIVKCPSCGSDVMQKSMIPVLAAALDGAVAEGEALAPAEGDAPAQVEGAVSSTHTYLCVACARTQVGLDPAEAFDT